MPWFVDQNNCVVKGTKGVPGKIVTCHPDHNAAVAHLRALYASEPELGNLSTVTIKRGNKQIALAPGAYSYKQDGVNRWIAITTVDKEDRDGETYGHEAIDWGLDWVKDHDEYPELRIMHVRGLKAGIADRMTRIGPFAVDEGRYFDTPLGKEAMRVVDSGAMQISRGFSVVEATGTCPCGSQLVVGPLALKYAYRCPSCDHVYRGQQLKDVRFTKAIPFDFSITDRPAVPWTVIVNKSKKEVSMSREDLIKRLVTAGFDEGVVASIVADMKDEDLERAKEDNAVEVFKSYVGEAMLKATNTRQTVEPDGEGNFNCYKCGAPLHVTAPTTKEVEFDADVIKMFKSLISETVKEVLEGFTPEIALPEAMEVEIPAESFKEITDQLAAMREKIDVLSQREDVRLAEINTDMSPASRSFLHFRMATKEQPDAALPTMGEGDVGIPMPNGTIAVGMDDYMSRMLGGE